ncbi:MAG: glutamate-cysteine ligase family protein [Planctomycetota bacterium]
MGSDARISDVAQLTDYFRGGIRPVSEFRVGGEFEKVGVFAESGRAVSYRGPRGVSALFRHLMSDHGWLPAYEGWHVVGLEKDGALITLEPGGQVEFSSAPRQTVHEVGSDVSAHLAEVLAISEGLGVRWLALGMQPLSIPGEIEWVPKGRYRIMSERFLETGARGHWMMQATASVQGAYDFESEEDAAEKFRVAFAVSPIVTALFANSPFRAGEVAGEASARAATWWDTDPTRCGLVPGVFRDDFDLKAYADYALDTPMLFVQRMKGWVPIPSDVTFRQFIERGYSGLTATHEDWELHLSTLFPEVRLKSFIEVRGCDSVPLPLAMSFLALMEGVLYDREARAAAWKLTASVPESERPAFHAAAYEGGLQGEHGGKSFVAYAGELLEIAEHGLTTWARASGRPSDVDLLGPAKGLVADGRSPAHRVLECWNGEWERDIARVLSATAYTSEASAGA